MRSIELAAGEELNPLIPHTAEIIVGFIAFSLLYMVLRRAVVHASKKRSQNALMRSKVEWSAPNVRNEKLKRR